ncbi:MAG TPA: type II toxin-antitoxin system VapC family toxin [Chloroflexota bacterium]
MLTNAKAVYLDSSALVKLVVRERESEELIAFLTHHPIRISCDLARVEVIRAVRIHGPRVVMRAREMLRAIQLVRLDRYLLDAAAETDPPLLRSLDAIHLAAAQALGETMTKFATYDVRLARVALDVGFTVVSPGG